MSRSSPCLVTFTVVGRIGHHEPDEGDESQRDATEENEDALVRLDRTGRAGRRFADTKSHQ